MIPLLVTIADSLARRFAQLRVQAEAGQTLIEYALILTIVSLGTVGALLVMTGKLNSFFLQVANNL